MAHSDTVDKILDSAEILFAEKGFSETSLRMITSKAQVNLAAVNYHFGSKNALIQAVFARFLGPLSQLMSKGLQESSALNDATSDKRIEDILSLYLRSILQVPTTHSNGVAVFMRLMGLAYTQSQGHLRKFLEQEYSRPFKLFMTYVKECTPHLTTEERFWRIQFSLGSIAFTMSSIEPLTEILENKQGVKPDPERVIDLLLPFLMAGFNASSTLDS